MVTGRVDLCLNVCLERSPVAFFLPPPVVVIAISPGVLLCR